jgi:WD40 repeat protein
VNFWNAETGSPLGHTLAGQKGLVSSVAYLAGDSELVTTSGDGKLRLSDIASGRLVGPPRPGADTGGWGDSSPTASTRSRSSTTAPA